MQNFNKKQMAIAVGAALTAVAGGATAAVTQSVLNKVLVSAGTGFSTAVEGKGLYSAAGIKTGKLTLKVVIATDNAGSAANIRYGSDTTGTAANNLTKPTVGIDLASSADAVNNFVIVATDGTTRVATVSLTEQKMFVAVTDNRGKTQTFVWEVSTGKDGFDTSKGQFTPTWLSGDHKSSQYEDAPMPNAVFFHQGVAVHGTDAVARLGTPASHGCVRLSQDNAETFFSLVEAYGKFNTKIVVTG